MRPVVTIALLWLLWSGPCVAQMSGQISTSPMLDALFPPGLPGAGTTPGTVVRSRIDPDYLPHAIQFGGLDLAPHLSTGFGYDSAPNGERPGTATFDIAPSLKISDELIGFGAYAGASIVRLPGNPAQNNITWSAALGEQMQWAETTASVQAAHATTQLTTLGLSTPSLTAPIQNDINAVNGEITQYFGIFSLTPKISVLQFHYGAALSSSDHILDRQSIELAADPPGDIRPLFLFRANQTHYAIGVPRQASANSASIEGLVGAETLPPDIWQFRALVGLATRHFAATNQKDRTAPVAELGLTWSLDPLVEIDMDAAHEIDDAAQVGIAGYTLSSLQFIASDEYFRNLILQLSTSIQSAQYFTTNLRAMSYDTLLSAEWHLSSRFAVTSSYEFTTRLADQSRCVNDQVVLFNLTWSP
ncbi:MAG TPA: outer membrane beta-barrel protein [Acetobacteraceae bacterium]|nr:outer membrane beta-barrel protein [Acetobacteraceae bacterium]